MNNYIEKEKIHIERISSEYEKNPHSRESAFDLLFEIEAFIFQTKSSLDIAVKIFNILFPGKFNLHTFHNKGADLVKKLTKLRTEFTEESTKRETIDNIISLINKDRGHWLDIVVKFRDTVSHYRTLPEFFYWIEEKDNNRILHVPSFQNLPVFDFVKLIYQNCLEFIQDLLCLAVELFWSSRMRIGLKPTYGKENSNAPMEKFIKFGISIPNLQTA